MKIESGCLLILSLIAVVLVIILSTCRLRCGKSATDTFRLEGDERLECEYQSLCAEDVRRHCDHSSGREGKCTLHGMCCPSFLLNASRNEELGYSPQQLAALRLGKIDSELR